MPRHLSRAPHPATSPPSPRFHMLLRQVDTVGPDLFSCVVPIRFPPILLHTMVNGKFLAKKKKILPLWLKGSLLMAFLALGIKGKPLISAFATFGSRAVNLFQLISHPCLPASALLDPAETRQSRMPSLQQTTCSLQ